MSNKPLLRSLSFPLLKGFIPSPPQTHAQQGVFIRDEEGGGAQYDKYTYK